MKVQIPKKITPCPIQEAVVGLRFETDIVSEAVFGIVYNEFKDQYKTVQKLPILNVPEEIRMNDPALMYQPWYHLKEENCIIAIGPKILGISNKKEYSGWAIFSEIILQAIEKIKKTNIIKQVTRVGIRYINFFDLDIFSKIDMEIKINGKLLDSDEMRINAKITRNSFKNTLQVVNNANILSTDKKLIGSVIDIDTYTQEDLGNLLNDYRDILERGHLVEKELFFSLLKEDFLKDLNPEY